MKRAALIASFLGTLAGCASNPAPVQLSPGIYYITREDKGGVFGNAEAMKASVINDANAFAKSQGMVAIPVTTHFTPMYPFHFATFEYQFKLVAPDSPEAKPTPLTQTPNVRVEQRGRTQVEIHDKSAAPKQDVYDELSKLDDLRKRGVITDAEFEAQKKKLLGEN
ncbi:MAG: SHOCT domain-containing protein [Rudaea sp.]